MKTTKDPIQHFLQIMDEAYKTHAWHGTNLRGSLRGVTAQQAGWRSRPGRHNIMEIVLHCAYWKYVVWRRMTGEKKGSFPLKGSNWIPCPSSPDGKKWKEAIHLLDTMHLSLQNSVRLLKSADLDRKPAGSTFTILRTISGIACHDVYHAGQIQLLKRLMKR